MNQDKRQTGREFTAVIYESDYKELCSWVLKKPNIETGGDLFGLWADKYTAVVQLVVGPGNGCRRTSVSFYQDVNYLKQVGSYLTESEGLCHIGEWHSHHTLGLAKPSGGDENTVWSNMPTYRLKRFVIFIANITRLDKESLAKVGCFLFELDSKSGTERPVLQGKFKILPDTNPFRSKRMMKKIYAQSESINDQKELAKLYLEKRNELEMSPTVYHNKSLESSKRKAQAEKQHALSPNLKQRKTKHSEAVTQAGHETEKMEVEEKHPDSKEDRERQKETEQRKTEHSEAVTRGGHTETEKLAVEEKHPDSKEDREKQKETAEELTKQLQQQTLNDNDGQVGVAKPALSDKQSLKAYQETHSQELVQCGHEDSKRKEEHDNKDTGPLSVENHEEDEEAAKARQIRIQGEKIETGRTTTGETLSEGEKGIQSKVVGGQQTECQNKEKAPVTVKKEGASKKVNKLPLKGKGTSRTTLQTSEQRKTAKAADNKGPKPSSKQTERLQRSTQVKPVGQTTRAHDKKPTTKPQKPTEHGKGTVVGHLQKSRREAAAKAQDRKEKTSSKKTSYSRSTEPGEGPASGTTRARVKKSREPAAKKGKGKA